jgi:hypothetical protein
MRTASIELNIGRDWAEKVAADTFDSWAAAPDHARQAAIAEVFCIAEEAIHDLDLFDVGLDIDADDYDLSLVHGYDHHTSNWYAIVYLPVLDSNGVHVDDEQVQTDIATGVEESLADLFDAPQRDRIRAAATTTATA